MIPLAAVRVSTRTFLPPVAIAFLLAAALLVAGCGGPNATVRNAAGDEVMLLGHDPVAYFTQGKPTRGLASLKASHAGRTYYFASPEHRALFVADPARYEPQYGGFCSSGAAYGVTLGSDPTEWEIMNGRLFVFGDVIGHELWKLDPKWNIVHADDMWPAIKDMPWRVRAAQHLTFRVPWYKTGPEIMSEWRERNPGRTLTYDPGGVVRNLLKYPGWRAAEGYGQPALGLPQ